jgi:uncharacterized RDD family membrane protein YckC
MSSSSDIPTARDVAELAGLRRRLASLSYESLLLLGILAAAFILPWMLILWLLDAHDPPSWLGVLELLHIFILFGGYFVWFWCRHGQTLAMQTWRLKVVSAADGRNPSWRRALLRYVLSWPSVSLCGVGLLWALLDDDRQFLHDRLAGTRVVLILASAKETRTG